MDIELTQGANLLEVQQGAAQGVLAQSSLVDVEIIINRPVDIELLQGRSSIEVQQGGAQGVPGSAANSYTHTQTIAATVWTVAHNLNRKPSITVVNNLDQRIEPDVGYVDANVVQVTHGTEITGKVFCN